MMVRGEIDFIYPSSSTGIFASQNEASVSQEDGGSEIYLVAIQAIVLYTVIGPVLVGLLVMKDNNCNSNDKSMVAVKIPWDFGAWYDRMTIPLNGMTG